jgi:3-oxoadipate enol-lactonase
MTDLWYDETGSGTPVVLLHEGVVDSRSWNAVVPLLGDRFRVIRYDQRGYGRSPMWTGPYSAVDDLVSVLDAAGVERAALVGCSRGGRIALATTVERPERVSALVLVGAPFPGRRLDVETTPDQDARWEAAEAAEDFTAMAEIDLEVWAPLGVDEQLRAMFVENARASSSEDPEREHRVADRLGDVRAPTLVLCGSRDVPAILEAGKRLADAIPGARHAVIDEADHMVPWRAPDELARLIREFAHQRS